MKSFKNTCWIHFLKFEHYEKNDSMKLYFILELLELKIFDISQCFGGSAGSAQQLQLSFNAAKWKRNKRTDFICYFYSFCLHFLNLISVILFVSKNNFDIFPLSSLGNWRHKIVTEPDERRHYDQSVFVKNVPKKWRKMHGMAATTS